MGKGKRSQGQAVAARRRAGCLAVTVLLLAPACLTAQDSAPETLSQQIQQLTDAMARTQAQLQESQRQLDEMRKQLQALQGQMAQGSSVAKPIEPSTQPSSDVATQLQDVRERQAIAESQIATHEQTKVESESNYPVKITGMLLLNGFVNTRAVNTSDAPVVAVSGAGSTAFTVRQTVLGFDARGPHLAGASSYADLRIDFFGNTPAGSSGSTYSGYFGSDSTFLRLRTAHAGLRWQNTHAYFSLDRPIISPDYPSSLVAVGEPALAWSGSLWAWNPQLGVAHDLSLGSTHALRLEGALIDAGNAPLSPSTQSVPTSANIEASDAEQSRWPGAEARIAFLGDKNDEQKSHVGVGGYFAPHLSALGRRYDAWAATLDTRLNLPGKFEFSGNFYRGAGLGGLGAGTYKDFGYRQGPAPGTYRLRALSDVGGWAQLKKRLGERVELNAALGIDNGFAHEIRRYPLYTNSVFEALSKNRTFTGNIIYSPSAYLLFSLEYRNVQSTPINGPASVSNIIGLGAGYKF